MELEGDGRRQLGARVAGAAQSLVEDGHALRERVREPRLFLAGDADDHVATRDERRIGRAHELDDALAETREKRLVEADRDALLHSAADDAPQDVVAPFVAGQDAVHDEKRDAAGMVGHDAQGARHRVARAVGLAGELLTELDQRSKGIGLEDRGDPLVDRAHAFEAHAGVDALRGERRQAAAFVHLVLHEDQVPVLHPAVALAAGAAVGPPAAELLAHVVVQLGARPAGSRGAGRSPEVVAPSEADNVVV